MQKVKDTYQENRLFHSEEDNKPNNALYTFIYWYYCQKVDLQNLFKSSLRAIPHLLIRQMQRQRFICTYQTFKLINHLDDTGTIKRRMATTLCRQDVPLLLLFKNIHSIRHTLYKDLLQLLHTILFTCYNIISIYLSIYLSKCAPILIVDQYYLLYSTLLLCQI